MHIRFVDDGYFFCNEFGFAEFVAEEKIKDYKMIKIRDFWEKCKDSVQHNLAANKTTQI